MEDWHQVVADTVQVITAGFDVIADDDVDDSLRFDEGWRRIISLDEARSEGLLLPPLVPPGLTSAELESRVRRMVKPLLAAGWVEIGVTIWLDWDDLEVGCELRRGDQLADVFYKVAGDALVLYPGGPNDSEDPTEPIGWCDATVPSATETYRDVGWL